MYKNKGGNKRKTMPLSLFDQTDPLRALAINDRTIKQSPAIGRLCGYNCSSSWYKTAMLESKRRIGKRQTKS